MKYAQIALRGKQRVRLLLITKLHPTSACRKSRLCLSECYRVSRHNCNYSVPLAPLVSAPLKDVHQRSASVGRCVLSLRRAGLKPEPLRKALPVPAATPGTGPAGAGAALPAAEPAMRAGAGPRRQSREEPRGPPRRAAPRGPGPPSGCEPAPAAPLATSRLK